MFLYKYRNAIRKYQNEGTREILSLDTPISSFDELESTTFLDTIPDVSKDVSTVDQLREFIEKDPQGIFASSCIHNKPEVNFRAILLRRFEGQTWQQISQDLHI